MKMDPRSFNSGGAVASSRHPPSLWRPPLGLAMISLSLECPPPRVSLVVDPLLLGDSEELDGVSDEWRLAHTIRVPQTLHQRKGGPNRHQKGLGWPAWAFPGPVLTHLVSRFVFCILDHGPLNCGLWTSLSPWPSWGVFMHDLLVFSSRSSGVLHSSTLVLTTFGGKFAHGRSSLIDLQNVLQTSCIFPHLIHEFLQKHSIPKCTSNGELVISLVCLVAG
jgi:hypothetical protein